MRITSSSRARRAGFALAGFLVALSVLVVGLLALAGTTAALSHAESEARRSARAASLLARRVESIAGAPCADSSGVRTVLGLIEQWRTWRVDSVQMLADTVRDAARNVVALEGAVRCSR